MYMSVHHHDKMSTGIYTRHLALGIDMRYLYIYHMYVTTKANITSFEWDRGNSDKNFNKHGITKTEAEELFIDEKVITHPDLKHSQKEARFIAIGKTSKGKLLFVIYTIRGENIRVVSVRVANKKDRETYENKKT